MARNKVVIQFKAKSTADFDRLLKIEETLFQAFSQSNVGVVDGHDIGQGTFNVFIHPRDSWGPVLERVEAFLKLRGLLDEAVIAKFHGKSERYQVVHPATHRGGFAL
jgi:hypothetical protein